MTQGLYQTPIDLGVTMTVSTRVRVRGVRAQLCTTQHKGHHGRIYAQQRKASYVFHKIWLFSRPFLSIVSQSSTASHNLLLNDPP